MLYPISVEGVGDAELVEFEGDDLFGPTVDSFICTYRGPHLRMAITCLGFSLLLLSIPLRQYALYRSLKATYLPGQTWDALGGLSPLFLALGILFVLWSVFYFYSSRNQTISFVNGWIVWRGATGKIRLRCRYNELIALSLRQSWHKGAYYCEVETAQGPMRWDSSISSAARLLSVARYYTGNRSMI